MAWLKTIFVAAVLLFVACGFLYVQGQRAAERDRALRELSAIAELKEDQVAAWRAVRLNEGLELMARRPLRDQVIQWLGDRTAAAPLAEALAQLDVIQQFGDFADITIIDEAGLIARRLRAEASAVAPELADGVAAAWRDRAPTFTVVYTDPATAEPRLGVVVPLLDGEAVRGAVALECDPRTTLFPILERWPVGSVTAESYLVSVDGDEVVYLSPLRHIAGGGTGLRLPKARTDIAAVEAALGEHGIKHAVDYRDVAVFSASIPVGDSPWVVVAEIDESEALAEVRRRTATVLALMAALLALLIAVAVAVWEFSLKARFAAMYEAEHAVARSGRLYDMLSQTNSLITHTPDRAELLEGVCRIAVERGGFLFAWYGELTPGGAVRPLFRAGVDGGYIDHVHATTDKRSEHSAGPMAQALMRSEHVICNDFLTNAATRSWHEAAKRAGIEASGAFPVLEGEHVAGAFSFYAGEPGFFTEADVATLDEMVADVSFGLANISRERERAEAVAALKELTERLDRYLSVSPVINYVLDVSGGSVKPIWVSHNIETLLGFEPAEALDPRWWSGQLHPDDREAAHRTMRALFETGQVQHEYRIHRKDGTELWVLDILRLVHDENGQAVQAVGAWSDITMRKHAEEALRLRSASLEAVANAVTITDREGLIEWVNPAFTELTGYGLDECIGRRPRDVVRREGHDLAFFEAIRSTIRSGKVWRGEVVNRRKDGSLFTVEATITPVRDESGRITHFVAVEQDVTNRKRLEEEFRQAQKMESIGRLAGGVAHDFNNLLSVINGYSEMTLSALTADSPLYRDITEIRHAAERAAKLTRQLLAFSRRQVLRPEVLDVNRSIRNLETMLRRLIGEHISFELDLAADAGPVLVDPGQFEQVMMNLLVNSRDAMPDGGRITVRTSNISRLRSGEGGELEPFVRIAVTDTGVGMDEEVQRRIFDPFFTTKEEGKGTGLGLSTVFGIVRQSGGVVEVRSAPGNGTTFTIDLPRFDGVQPASKAADKPSAAEGGVERILLVEDEDALRRLTQRTLEMAGYTVYAAAHGAEALAMVERGDVDVELVLTDVVMPGVSGPKLAAELLERRPGLKILFMSGYTDDSLSQYGALDPERNLINKPFTRGELTQAIRRALGKEEEAGR